MTAGLVRLVARPGVKMACQGVEGEMVSQGVEGEMASQGVEGEMMKEGVEGKMMEGVEEVMVESGSVNAVVMRDVEEKMV